MGKFRTLFSFKSRCSESQCQSTKSNAPLGILPLKTSSSNAFRLRHLHSNVIGKYQIILIQLQLALNSIVVNEFKLWVGKIPSWPSSHRCYISISILGSYPSHFINAYGTNPTTQKNRVLLWYRGWLGLVIGFFGWAGRMVDMPRVLDERAGWCRGVGLLSRGWGY